MTTLSLRRTLTWGILCIVLAISISACRPVEQPPLPSPTAAVSPAADTPVPTASPTPTALPPLAVFWAPPGANAGLAGAARAILEERALQSGLRFEQRESITLADLQQDVQLVVSLPPAENLAELAAGAPQTKFIALGAQALQPAENLSVVQLPGSTADQAAFIAGYLAGAVAQDWRAGLLVAQGAPESAAASTAYANGLAFLCGLCRPVYPPFPIPGYPIVVELTAPADQAGWETAVAELKNWQVQVVYVTPQAASPELFQTLAQAGLQIIGAGSPPDGTQPQWIASLGGQDLLPVLLRAWDAAIAGSAGEIYRLELALTNVNPELLSPGRQQLVEALIADLAAGFIDIGVASTPASQP